MKTKKVFLKTHKKCITRPNGSTERVCTREFGLEANQNGRGTERSLLSRLVSAIFIRFKHWLKSKFDF